MLGSPAAVFLWGRSATFLNINHQGVRRFGTCVLISADKTVTMWLLLYFSKATRNPQKRPQKRRRRETFGAVAISYQRRRALTSKSQGTRSHPKKTKYQRRDPGRMWRPRRERGESGKLYKVDIIHTNDDSSWVR